MKEVKKRFKEKGIALCHIDQGYSANLRPASLLMKSDIKPENITVDLIKTLQQVTVTMSFEEFLSRFFYMWEDDARLLAKLLGFQTELEYDALQNPSDQFLQEYNAFIQEQLEEQMGNIEIMKSALDKKQDEISLQDQFSIIKVQAMFEQNAKVLGIDLNKFDININHNNNKVINKNLEKKGKNMPAENKDLNKSQETGIEKSSSVNEDLIKQVELLKSQLAEKDKKTKEYDDVIKTMQHRIRQENIAKAKSFSFIEEADIEKTADVIEDEAVLEMLTKAQAKIEELNKTIETFATSEHGHSQAIFKDVANANDKNSIPDVDAKIEMLKSLNAKK